MSFIGNPLVSMNYPVDYFTGDGSTYIFTLSNTPASTSSIIVSVNGTKLVSSSSNPGYYLNGSTLTLSSTPPLNATVEVVYLGVLSQVNVPADLSVTPEMLSIPVSNTLVYQTTANGSQSTFTLPYPPISANSLIVTANGVVQYDYTVNGADLVLNFVPANNTIVRAQSLAYANEIVPVDGSVSSSKLQSNLVLTGNTTVDNLTVTNPISGSVTGSANTATYEVITNANTGLYYPQLVSATSGTLTGYANNAFVFDVANGRMGIGTSSPSYKLDVQNGSGAAVISNKGSTGSNYYGWYGSTLITQIQSAANQTYLNSVANVPLLFGTNDTIRLTIDTSGNLGLGITPSSWQSVRKALQIGGSGSFVANATGNGFVFIGNNWYLDSAGTNTYINTAAASRFDLGSDGSFRWNIASSGTANNPITFTQAMTLNSSGNLGVGVTSPNGRLHVQSPAITAAAPSLGWPAYNAESDTNSKNIFIDTAGNGSVSTSGYGATVSLVLGQYYDSRVVITPSGSGGASPSDQGTGYGKDLLLKAGTSDNGIGYSGGRLYLSGGSGYSSGPGFNSNYGNVVIQPFGGNVGIGTTNPTTPLYIQHTNFAADPFSALYIKNTSTSGNAYTGAVVDGYFQSHYRYALNGTLKWQTRVGAGNGTDDFRIYSWTRGADVLTIDNTGLLSLDKGQIKFPATQNASADANTLDDYEEGTWTPTVGGNATYTHQSGGYIKIGKAVYLNFDFGVSVLGTGSNKFITGLPFVFAGQGGNARACGSVSYFVNVATTASAYYLHIDGNGMYLNIHNNGVANVSDGPVWIQNSTRIMGTIHYTSTN